MPPERIKRSVKATDITNGNAVDPRRANEFLRGKDESRVVRQRELLEDHPLKESQYNERRRVRPSRELLEGPRMKESQNSERRHHPLNSTRMSRPSMPRSSSMRSGMNGGYGMGPGMGMGMGFPMMGGMGLMNPGLMGGGSGNSLAASMMTISSCVYSLNQMIYSVRAIVEIIGVNSVSMSQMAVSTLRAAQEVLRVVQHSKFHAWIQEKSKKSWTFRLGLILLSMAVTSQFQNILSSIGSSQHVKTTPMTSQVTAPLKPVEP